MLLKTYQESGVIEEEKEGSLGKDANMSSPTSGISFATFQQIINNNYRKEKCKK